MFYCIFRWFCNLNMLPSGANNGHIRDLWGNWVNLGVVKMQNTKNKRENWRKKIFLFLRTANVMKQMCINWFGKIMIFDVCKKIQKTLHRICGFEHNYKGCCQKPSNPQPNPGFPSIFPKFFENIFFRKIFFHDHKKYFIHIFFWHLVRTCTIQKSYFEHSVGAVDLFCVLLESRFFMILGKCRKSICTTLTVGPLA